MFSKGIFFLLIFSHRPVGNRLHSTLLFIKNNAYIGFANGYMFRGKVRSINWM